MAESQPYPPANDYPLEKTGAPGHDSPPPPYQAQPPPRPPAPAPARPPAYEAPPPSFPYQSPPQPHEVGGTTVIVQQVPPKVESKPAKPKKQRKGLFDSLLKEVDSVVKTVTHGVHDFVGQNTTGSVLELFQTGNVVQLVSRTTGKSLQVVRSANGQLVVDGRGQTTGEPPFNTVWTIVAEGKNQIRLQNDNNYLIILNGETSLVNMPPGAVHGIETRFQLHLVMGHYVMIESMKEHGRHIGIMPDGSLKQASSTGRELNSHFAVSLVYSPYTTSAAPQSN